MAATKRREDPVFLEALRSMPALVLAHESDQPDDAKFLLAAIMESGKEAGLCPAETNRQMFHAAWWWLRETMKAMSDDRGQPFEELVRAFSQAGAEYAARNE